MPEKEKTQLEKNIEKLQNLLGELFQVESADLDFGIYRIMRQRRGEIRKFIEKDLTDTITKECAAIHATPEETAAIFDHIYQFFSRYYDKGDFMPLHRHSLKDRKYAVPWNGEEVVLHWANKDQYYIKTGMNFKDYVFRDEQETYRIHFTLVEGDVPKNNVKEKDSYFILQPGKDAITFDKTTKTLTARFIYTPLSADDAKKQSGARSDFQKAFSKTAEDAILAAAKSADTGLFNILSKKEEKKKSDKTEPPTYLAKHLTRYVHENKSDFFIHKDLGGFLRQELDTYLKREMYDLNDLIKDDTVAQDPALYKSCFERIRLMRSISLTIIDFLAQIEDFQKRLWEKKKFVLKSEYCMTLDHVPERFYKEILKSKAQIEEWKRLYGIGGKGGQATLAGSTINEAFLKAHPYLVLDTVFFPELKEQLIDSLQTPDGKPVEDLDEAMGGLMVKSENWQALNLLQERYREQVKCIYIDPPYNTGNDEFLYKDNYQHSSWLAMMRERMLAAKKLMNRSSVIWVSNDDNEIYHSRQIMNNIFGEENFFSQVIVRANSRGQTYKQIAKTHEYVLAFTKDSDKGIFFELGKDAESDDLNLTDDLGKYNIRELRNRNPKFGRHNRPNLFYPIFVNPNKRDKDGFSPISLQRTKDYSVEILPFNSEGGESCWRWGKEKTEKNCSELTLKSNIIAKKKQSGEFGIFEKYRKTTFKPKSIWLDNEFLTETGTVEIGNLKLNEYFSFPKPIALLKQCIALSSQDDDVILDFFAGSGTAAHAMLALNSEDNGERKYILVEMANYFDTVMKPRIQKVMFASEWKEGSPVQGSEGLSHIFKYIILEQYEDTLNNIEFAQKRLGEDAFHDYLLHYLLEAGTRQSMSRFGVTAITDPWAYELKIYDENIAKYQNVDLIETFNYLLGIHVKRYQTFTNGKVKYRVVIGEKADALFIIIWRKTDGLDLKADKKFVEKEILPGIRARYPSTSEKIYINGNSHVNGADAIEPEFSRLMGG